MYLGNLHKIILALGDTCIDVRIVYAETPCYGAIGYQG